MTTGHHHSERASGTTALALIPSKGSGTRSRSDLAEPRLKAGTLFEWPQQTYDGQFPDSTRQTYERRVNRWRSLHGTGKVIFFDQEHHPERLAASDFTVCNELCVKISGQRFDHTFFHCVLTYSNVESVSLCFSESFEALNAGIQKAFREFRGVPQRHRSDLLAAAVRNHTSRQELTDRYCTPSSRTAVLLQYPATVAIFATAPMRRRNKSQARLRTARSSACTIKPTVSTARHGFLWRT